MSRFPQMIDAGGHAALAPLYEEIVAAGFGRGSPMNWFTAQSERPDILATTFAFCRTIMLEGQLPPTIKQMIIVRVSTLNDCTYCRLTHRRALQALEVPDEVIDNITTGLDLTRVPPQQRAVLEFATKASQASGTVTDADLEALRDYGFSDGELIEIVMTTAMTNFINIWSDASAIEIDADTAT